MISYRFESAFNILRKMADYKFAQALSWEAAQLVHEQWLLDYNNQAHWAHRKRNDAKRTPLEVLDGIKAPSLTPVSLRRLFRNRYERHADRWGYIRFPTLEDLHGNRGWGRHRGSLVDTPDAHYRA